MANKKKKLIIITSIVIIALLAIGVGAYFYIQSNPKILDGVSIGKMFDENGKLVWGGQQAVVGGQQGVRYITLKVAVTNTDTVPLSFSIIDASTADFKSALTLNTPVTVEAGAQKVWESSQIDMYPYINSSGVFSATIQATSPYRQTSTKVSSTNVAVTADPVSQFTVVITSTVGNTTNQPNTCPSGQTLCSDSICRTSCTTTCPSGQTLCTDGTCKTSCTPLLIDFVTNAVPGAYANYKSGTWVQIDYDRDSVLEQYTFSKTTSSNIGCYGTSYGTTPEGYSVKTYSGTSGIQINICNPSSSPTNQYAVYI